MHKGKSSIISQINDFSSDLLKVVVTRQNDSLTVPNFTHKITEVARRN